MESFATLLTEQIPRLRRYAKSLTRESVLADELVQDCLERAWSRAGRWRRGSDLRAWLFTIMHNLFVNRVRREARTPPLVALDERDADPIAADPEGSRQIDELERALAGLSPEQREVLSLVALEGLRYEEVAAILDIPLGTVMSRLYRARERLRRLLTSGEPARALRRIK